MREIIPRTLTGADPFSKVDSNGATWTVSNPMTGTYNARSETYSPPGSVFGSSMDDVSKKIDTYAKTHNVGAGFNDLGAYTDENGAIWFKTDQWKPYLSAYPPKIVPLGTAHWLADTNYYKPYTKVTGGNDFELKDAIDKFAYSYSGGKPLVPGSSTKDDPASPPIVIKSNPTPDDTGVGDEAPPKPVPVPAPVPGNPPAPAPKPAQVASGSSNTKSLVLGSVAAISGILWWRSR